ncbi:MAG: alpha-glucosidase/alpha-galactosidase, partial [Chloroflexi bacterium]|nr:alpha-glucosidase/alpha-galactosidase [Chloroflexota bacterium]
IRQVLEEQKVTDYNRVRYEMFKRLGYFVTESSEHFSEYVPWFIKRDRPDLIEEFNIPLDEYITRCETQLAEWKDMRVALEDSDPDAMAKFEQARFEDLITKVAQKDPQRAAVMRESLAKRMQEQKEQKVRRSSEYGSLIIHSMETGQPRVVYGNVPNRGLIDNLPQGCTVEVPCLVDKNGVQPVEIGQLPPQLAALMQTNLNVQSLTVEAALTHKREHIYHAAMLDPHTAAELSLEQIWNLVDDLIEAHGDWLPKYE